MRQAWLCWRWVRLESDQFVVQMPLGTRRVDYRAISRVQLIFQRLRLSTEHGTITLRGHADTLTHISSALEQRLISLDLYQAKPADTSLPIRLWARWLGSLLLGLFGLGILIVAIVSIVYLAINRQIPLSAWLSQMSIAVIAALIGGGLVYMFATTCSPRPLSGVTALVNRRL